MEIIKHLMSRWNNKDYYKGHYHSNGNYNNHKNSYGNYSNNYTTSNDNYYPLETTNRARNYKNCYEKDIQSYPIQDEAFFLKTLNQTVNIQQLKSYCKEYQSVIKVVEIENPINSNAMLVDISMSSKGVDEEKTYLNHPEMTSVIRRGNTLIEYYYVDQYGSYIYDYCEMLRKGMKKFVDIPFDFIDPKDKDSLSLNYSLETSKVEALKYIFYPIFQALKEGFLIEIIKIMKANGENAQISYSKKLKCWAIASKNVCLCAKDRSDFKKYDILNKETKQNTRWYFAYLIGNCWFDIIDSLTSTPELITELQEYIADKTLIGEYVGNQNHQHLVRYMKHTILFFGIVKNNSTDNSLPVLEAFSIFKRFRLDVVPYEYIGTIETKQELFTALKQLYVRIAESSIIDEEEGSVIYFSQTCARTIKSNPQYRKNDKILSLGKLKTYEYRIYRKLREKLKNHLEIDNCENSRKKINQFFEEIRLMTQGFSLPMPLEFYYKVADVSFEFANKLKGQITDLHSNYIDFIEVIHSIIDDSISLKSRAIKFDNIMTYNTLIQNQLKSKTIIEIIIYAPPCYLSDCFLKELSNNFNSSIYNQLIEEDNYSSISSSVILYHINMHNFRNIIKLAENKLIVFLGLNEVEIKKGLNCLKEKLKNPSFKSYNTNKSLLPFFKENEDDMNNTIDYYLKASINFVSKCKEKIKSNIIVYESFEESLMKDYINNIDAVVSLIKDKTEKINLNNIVEDSFYTNRTSLIDIDNTLKTKKQYSKYNGNPFISIYEEHINPFEKLKKEYEEIINIEQNEKKEENVISSSAETINNIVENNSLSSEKIVIVLIPMTIPGNGKTFFIEQLIPMMKEYSIDFYTLSNDKIRREVMDEMISSNRMTEAEAFASSGKKANYIFEQKLRKTFQEIYWNKSSNKALIYIDKNHPPNAIYRSTEGIKDFLRNNFNSQIKLNLQFVALIPLCVNHFSYGKSDFIPFSLSYFIQCYLRVKHRRDHPTLNGGSKELIPIFGMFIKNFNTVNLNDNTLINHYKLDKVIQLPFTDEMTEDVLPKELVVSAKDYFSHIQRTERITLDSKAELLEHYIQYYYFKGNEFFSTKGLVSSTAEPIITKLFNITINTIYKIKSFLYLGVLISGEKNYVPFKSTIDNGLKAIKAAYTFNTEDICNLINCLQLIREFSLPKDWKYPHKFHKNLWHCTTLYKGNKSITQFNKEKEYEEYIEGKEIKVSVYGLIYIPDKIITSIILMNPQTVNKFPHITSFINGYAPKVSNIIMNELFSKDGPLRNEYEIIVSDYTKTNKEEIIKKVEIKIENELVNCFVIIYDQPLILHGVMHAFEQ